MRANNILFIFTHLIAGDVNQFMVVVLFFLIGTEIRRKNMPHQPCRSRVLCSVNHDSKVLATYIKYIVHTYQAGILHRRADLLKLKIIRDAMTVPIGMPFLHRWPEALRSWWMTVQVITLYLRIAGTGESWHFSYYYQSEVNCFGRSRIGSGFNFERTGSESD